MTVLVGEWKLDTETKVRDSTLAIGLDENVFALQIAMHDTGFQHNPIFYLFTVEKGQTCGGREE